MLLLMNRGGLVFSEIFTEYSGKHWKDGIAKIPVTTICERLNNRKTGYLLKERQIAGIARKLHFQIVKPHGKAHIVVKGLEQLKEIAYEIGLGEEVLEDEPPTPMLINAECAVST